MTEAEKTLRFSKEYLKDKNVLQEMQEAMKYCLNNNLITQQQIDEAMADRNKMMLLGNKALAIYLRKKYQEQNQ